MMFLSDCKHMAYTVPRLGLHASQTKIKPRLRTVTLTFVSSSSPLFSRVSVQLGLALPPVIINGEAILGLISTLQHFTVSSVPEWKCNACDGRCQSDAQVQQREKRNRKTLTSFYLQIPLSDSMRNFQSLMLTGRRSTFRVNNNKQNHHINL